MSNLPLAVKPLVGCIRAAVVGVLFGGAMFASAANAGALTFSFDFSGNTPDVGFLDPVSGAARQQALFTAGALFSDLYSSHFSGSAVLEFSVTSTFDPVGSTLASAGSQEIAAAGFGNGDVIRTKIQTGIDINDASVDGTVDVNWGYNWQIDPNTSAVASGPNASYDFFAALNHEFTHALGFGSNINAVGDTPGSYSKWDQFLTNQAGVLIVDPTTMLVNLAAYSDAQTNGGSFIGANAIAGYGAPVPMVVNPDISHLNTDVFSPPTVPGPYMMVPARDYGPQEARMWSATEIGILTDLGYAAAVPEPSSVMMMLLGIGAIGFSQRKKT